MFPCFAFVCSGFFFWRGGFFLLISLSLLNKFLYLSGHDIVSIRLSAKPWPLYFHHDLREQSPHTLPNSYNFNYVRQGCQALKVPFTETRSCSFLFPLNTSIFIPFILLQPEMLSDWINSSDAAEWLLTLVHSPIKIYTIYSFIWCKCNQSQKFKKASKLLVSQEIIQGPGEHTRTGDRDRPYLSHCLQF